MTDETTLLPCPFCGGEAEMLIEGKHGHYTFHHEGARKCPAAYAHYADYTTEAEAIAAWNTRAERTCECVAEYAKSPIDGKTIVLHRCSACHELMRPHMAYCPNCGAKVIGGDAE